MVTLSLMDRLSRSLSAVNVWRTLIWVGSLKDTMAARTLAGMPSMMPLATTLAACRSEIVSEDRMPKTLDIPVVASKTITTSSGFVTMASGKMILESSAPSPGKVMSTAGGVKSLTLGMRAGAARRRAPGGWGGGPEVGVGNGRVGGAGGPNLEGGAVSAAESGPGDRRGDGQDAVGRVVEAGFGAVVHSDRDAGLGVEIGRRNPAEVVNPHRDLFEVGTCRVVPDVQAEDRDVPGCARDGGVGRKTDASFAEVLNRTGAVQAGGS